jgi:hypothetical protein
MRNNLLLGLCVILALSVCTAGQSSANSVESINKRYVEISEKARLCETDDEQGQFGELFMNELTINSRSHQWRAVGVYGQKFRFFYKQVENDERRLYPDQLVFVKAERKVSARTYSEEFLFSETGSLIFYFQRSTNDEAMPAERRVYFAGSRAIRVAEDSKTRTRLTAKDGGTVKDILAASRRINEIFARSLKM